METAYTVAGKRYRGTLVHNNPSAHVNSSLSKEERSFEIVAVDMGALGNGQTSMRNTCFSDPELTHRIHSKDCIKNL